jgi:hypothetical protein
MSEPKETFRQWNDAKKKARKPSVVPPEVAEILGKPALLAGEDRDWYEDTRAKFAAAIKPEDCVVWIFVDDFAYYTSEILRYRRLKAATVDSARLLAVHQMVSEPISSGQVKIKSTIDDLVEAYFRSGAWRLYVEETFGITPDFVNSSACRYMQSELVAIDKTLASLETRRMMVLREIELRRLLVARRLREISRQLLIDADARPASPEPTSVAAVGPVAAAANDDLNAAQSVRGNAETASTEGQSADTPVPPGIPSGPKAGAGDPAANLPEAVSDRPAPAAADAEETLPESLVEVHAPPTQPSEPPADERVKAGEASSAA